MVYDKILKGKYVKLRSIELSDAEFSMKIRQDKKKTKYLHVVEASVEKQIEWIKKQRKMEGDYFFITESLSDEGIGTLGIYDIKKKVGHLGRLLMVGNPFQTFEAIILAMHFAYDILDLDELYGDVQVENTPSLHISEAVGFHFDTPVYDEVLDRWFRYGKAYKSEFSSYKSKINDLIYR